MLADFVVKHKKQVVKLFAVVKWARDASDVQKCMVGVPDSLLTRWHVHGFRLTEYNGVLNGAKCAV